MVLFDGSIRRKFSVQGALTMCAKDAASSTPVGPAPTSTKRHLPRAFALVPRSLRRVRTRSVFSARDRLGVAEVLGVPAHNARIVVPKVSSGACQSRPPDNRTQSCGRPCPGRSPQSCGKQRPTPVTSRQEYAEVSAASPRADGSAQRSRRERARCRHLIEQRLKNVVVAAVRLRTISADGVPQAACDRASPAKPPADNHDPRFWPHAGRRPISPVGALHHQAVSQWSRNSGA